MLREYPQKLLFRLLLLLAVSAAVLIWVMMDWPCVFRSVTGWPCPGCGMSRAWKAALRLDWKAAFRYHPMFWSVPVFMLLFLFGRRLFRRRWIGRCLLSVLLGGMAVCYLYELIIFLN